MWLGATRFREFPRLSYSRDTIRLVYLAAFFTALGLVVFLAAAFFAGAFLVAVAFFLGAALGLVAFLAGAFLAVVFLAVAFFAGAA